MIDTWLYSWPDSTLDLSTPDWTSDSVLTDFITFYSYFICYFYFILVYIFHSLLTFICTCIFHFILTHSLGVLSPWICISRSVAIYFWSGIWRGSYASWGAGVLLLDPFSVFYVSSLFHRFHDYAVDSVLVLSFYSYVIIVLDIYMSYCNDIDLS